MNILISVKLKFIELYKFIKVKLKYLLYDFNLNLLFLLWRIYLYRFLKYLIITKSFLKI